MGADIDSNEVTCSVDGVELDCNIMSQGYGKQAGDSTREKLRDYLGIDDNYDEIHELKTQNSEQKKLIDSLRRNTNASRNGRDKIKNELLYGDDGRKLPLDKWIKYAEKSSHALQQLSKFLSEGKISKEDIPHIDLNKIPGIKNGIQKKMGIKFPDTVKTHVDRLEWLKYHKDRGNTYAGEMYDKLKK